jgi:hypothetical protein
LLRSIAETDPPGLGCGLVAMRVKVAWQIRRLRAGTNDAGGHLGSTNAFSTRYSVKNLSGRLRIDFQTVRKDARGLLEDGIRVGEGSFHEDSFTRQRVFEGRRGSGLGRTF